MLFNNFENKRSNIMAIQSKNGIILSHDKNMYEQNVQVKVHVKNEPSVNALKNGGSSQILVYLNKDISANGYSDLSQNDFLPYGILFEVKKREEAVKNGEKISGAIIETSKVVAIKSVKKDSDGSYIFSYDSDSEQSLFSIPNDTNMGDIEQVFQSILAQNKLKPYKSALTEMLSKGNHEELFHTIFKLMIKGEIKNHFNNNILNVASAMSFYDDVSIQDKLVMMFQVFAQDEEMGKRISQASSKVQTDKQKELSIHAIEQTMRDLKKQKDVLTGENSEELVEKIKAKGLPENIETKLLKEADRISRISHDSSEKENLLHYIETILSLPFNERTELNHDLKMAEDILNAEHYGLEEVKERILEYLAVQKRVGKNKATVLCLTGAPGVGKTSLGQSIANATGRKFIRIALGGMSDEAEIRGHRRTYVGSKCGRILQAMIDSKVNNPLILLDEIDKLGKDQRGDPSAALLEVLDPNQNHTFVDRFVEVEYDLSNVLFIATSNYKDAIPEPLLDRMEVIQLSSYMEDEKQNIAERHLVQKAMKNNGLNTDEIEITQQAITEIIRYYVREAGVRDLEKQIAKLCRKIVMDIERNPDNKEKRIITEESVKQYLGVRKADYGKSAILKGEENPNKVGLVNGLAWTAVGGDMLEVEAVALHGDGKINSTGKLGDVMKESVQVAWAVIRNNYEYLGLEKDFYKHHDVAVHFPAGAVPKDGPSAGITVSLAIASALTQKAVRADLAMTGEVSLQGDVLPIGGLKEKLIAAERGGIKTVLIPHENVKDLEEVPQAIKDNLEIIPVKKVQEVFEHGLIANK